MATGEPPCQSEDQSPQPISQGHALEVVIADEIPRQSGLQKASGLLPQACAQKRKRDWSSGSEEELHEDLLGHTDGVPRQAPYFMPQSPAHRKEKDYAPSELESEAEQEKDHQRESDSALSRKPSLQLRSTGHKWNREWSSNLEEGEEMGRPRYFDLAPREVHCLPPRKRWREYLSLCSEEPQQSLEPLSPVPSTHTGVRAKPCGLKKKMKMKHLSSVLPEHHTAFTRLLEDPVVRRFLAWDVNFRVSDKYLLAMVIVYFSRAGLFPWQYQRIHFFLALYLANDIEEDDELQKLHMFFFLYGRNMARIPKFYKLRQEFICCMDWDLRVTREECEEIQAYDPGLWVWRRDRTCTVGSLEP